MKKKLIDWIDRETVRLVQVKQDREPGRDENDPVPESLRQALADTLQE